MTDAPSNAVVVTAVNETKATPVPVVDVSPTRQESSETAVEVKPVQEEIPLIEAPPEERISNKLLQIKEREVRAAQKEAEVEKRFQEAERVKSLLESFKKTPSKALAELGLTFNDLASAMLSEDGPEEGPSEIELVKKTVDELRAELKAKEEKVIADRDAEEARLLDDAILGIKNVIDKHIDGNEEKYDLIKATNSNELVYEIMAESYKQTGTVMHYTDACDLAEDYLTDKVKVLTKSRKLQGMVTPPKPAKTSFSRTLTNQLSQTSTGPKNTTDVAKMSHEERIRHAAKLISFN